MWGRDASWWKLREASKTASAPSTTNSWRFSVAKISSAYVTCALLTNTKTMMSSWLGRRCLRKRYVLFYCFLLRWHNTRQGYSIRYIALFLLAFQIKLGKMQRQTAKMIQTWEKEEQGLKQTIQSFKVYLFLPIEIRFCYEALIFIVICEWIHYFYFFLRHQQQRQWSWMRGALQSWFALLKWGSVQWRRWSWLRRRLWWRKLIHFYRDWNGRSVIWRAEMLNYSTWSSSLKLRMKSIFYK